MAENEQQAGRWAIVELMGHVRFGARLGEEQVAGVSLLRADIFRGSDAAPCMTKLIGAPAIYTITYVEELAARLVADYSISGPVADWDLHKLVAQDLPYLKRLIEREENQQSNMSPASAEEEAEMEDPEEDEEDEDGDSTDDISINPF